MAMHGRICSALVALLSLSVPSRAETPCLDPAALAHSTVAITRYFDDAERATARIGVIGAQGTAWFLSPTTIVTVAHVAEGMKLSTQVWKAIEMQDGDEIRPTAARIQRIVGHQQEKLAVLELQKPVAGARSAAIRTAPLAPEDRVVALPIRPAGRVLSAAGSC